MSSPIRKRKATKSSKPPPINDTLMHMLPDPIPIKMKKAFQYVAAKIFEDTKNYKVMLQIEQRKKESFFTNFMQLYMFFHAVQYTKFRDFLLEHAKQVAKLVDEKTRSDKGTNRMLYLEFQKQADDARGGDGDVNDILNSILRLLLVYSDDKKLDDDIKWFDVLRDIQNTLDKLQDKTPISLAQLQAAVRWNNKERIQQIAAEMLAD